MTEHVDGDDYSLRVLIERMQRLGRSEREIEIAVREASGCPAHRASLPWTTRRRPPLRTLGRRLQGSDRLRKSEEAQQ